MKNKLIIVIVVGLCLLGGMEYLALKKADEGRAFLKEENINDAISSLESAESLDILNFINMDEEVEVIEKQIKYMELFAKAQEEFNKGNLDKARKYMNQIGSDAFFK